MWRENLSLLQKRFLWFTPAQFAHRRQRVGDASKYPCPTFIKSAFKPTVVDFYLWQGRRIVGWNWRGNDRGNAQKKDEGIKKEFHRNFHDDIFCQ